MSAKKIGERLVELCSQGKNLDAINELYAEDVTSIEAAAPPEGERISKGIDAVRAKNEWWSENHEVHDASVKGPFPHGEDRFCVVFNYDVTNKPSGQRFPMEEVALFTLSGGKIAQEEFFYSMG